MELESNIYIKEKEIGSGSYATVYLAKSTKENKKYALKEIKMKEKEGIPYSAIIEIILLKELEHPNILNIVDVLHGKKTITLVLDYIESNLKKIILQNPEKGLSPSLLKNYLYQILKGIAYMHKKKILHRDIKPENILMTSNGVAKIADFGLSRDYGLMLNGYCSCVVTLQYRSPELLLGSQYYGPEVDIWSVGCIFAEMAKGQVLFLGSDENSQLDKIFRIRGTPTSDNYPEFNAFKKYSEEKRIIKNYPVDDIKNYVPNLDHNGLDLLNKMLQINPDNRISAEDALLHPFFDDIDPIVFNIYQSSKYVESSESDDFYDN